MLNKDPTKRPLVSQLLDFDWFENINMLMAPPLPTGFGGMGIGGGINKIGTPPETPYEIKKPPPIDDSSEEDEL